MERTLEKAKHMHATVPPEMWCVTRSTLIQFAKDVCTAWKSGRIPQDPTHEDPRYDDPAVGPSVYQVTKHFIKPVTLEHGGMSYALMKHPEGLKADIFVTHAWAEGIFEFVDKLLQSWPRGGRNAWICFLANPQNLDISELLNVDVEDTPFARALKSADCMVVVPTKFGSIYRRLWCVLEAYLAAKWEKSMRLPTKVSKWLLFKSIFPHIVLMFVGFILAGFTLNRSLKAPVYNRNFIAPIASGEDLADFSDGHARPLSQMHDSSGYLDARCRDAHFLVAGKDGSHAPPVLSLAEHTRAASDQDIVSHALLGLPARVDTPDGLAAVVACSGGDDCASPDGTWKLSVRDEQQWTTGSGRFHSCSDSSMCLSVVCVISGCEDMEQSNSLAVLSTLLSCVKVKFGVAFNVAKSMWCAVMFLAVVNVLLGCVACWSIERAVSYVYCATAGMLFGSLCLVVWLYRLLYQMRSEFINSFDWPVYEAIIAFFGVTSVFLVMALLSRQVSFRHRDLLEVQMQDVKTCLEFDTVCSAQCFDPGDERRIRASISGKEHDVDCMVKLLMEAGAVDINMRQKSMEGKNLHLKGIFTQWYVLGIAALFWTLAICCSLKCQVLAALHFHIFPSTLHPTVSLSFPSSLVVFASMVYFVMIAVCARSALASRASAKFVLKICVSFGSFEVAFLLGSMLIFRSLNFRQLDNHANIVNPIKYWNCTMTYKEFAPLVVCLSGSLLTAALTVFGHGRSRAVSVFAESYMWCSTCFLLTLVYFPFFSDEQQFLWICWCCGFLLCLSVRFWVVKCSEKLDTEWPGGRSSAILVSFIAVFFSCAIWFSQKMYACNTACGLDELPYYVCDSQCSTYSACTLPRDPSCGLFTQRLPWGFPTTALLAVLVIDTGLLAWQEFKLVPNDTHHINAELLELQDFNKAPKAAS